MKSIKAIGIAALLTVGAFCMVLYTYCKKEKNQCLNINCLNGGACNYGTCICPTGYGGIYCEVNTDLCKGITCLNGGTCKDGKCSCPSGSGGTLCETVYRDAFAGTYIGNGTDNYTPPNSYANWKATFTPTGTDISKMQLTLRENSGFQVFTSTITLSNFITSGAVYTISPTFNGTYTYSGSGTFNGSHVSLILTETGSSSSDTYTYTFTSMTRM